ncbi:MAG: hypothetical protein H7255_16895 [Ramlibacter sp.]|nr:hypothetical protein [Ramlibacter sp.]
MKGRAFLAQLDAEHNRPGRSPETSERLGMLPAFEESWRDTAFGGCDCEAQRPVCNCAVASWLAPAPIRSARPSERSETTATLAVVLLGVMGAVIVALETGVVRSVMSSVARWFA